MRTNREKYEHYCAQIAAKDAAAIAALMPVVPAQFFTIRQFEAVPIEVTHVSGVHRRGVYKHNETERVSRDEVETVKKHAEEWVAPTMEEIFVHYKEKQSYGVVTGAHKFSKINVAEKMAWSAEELADECVRQRELYAPREGHTQCAYCRKQHPTEGLVSREIFYRDRGGLKTKIGQYCSEQCGFHDQCGHEG